MGTILVNEKWNDVVGWETLYQVSNMGRVRSKDRYIGTDNNQKIRRGKLLKLKYDNKGYCVVSLSDKMNGLYKLAKVHRLVALAFIPNPNNKPFIDHINSIRDDNRVENLRWCTCKENLTFPTAIKNSSDSMKRAYKKNPDLLKKRVEHLRNHIKRTHVSVYKNNVHIGDYKSVTDAAKSLGLSRVSLSACLHGRLKTIKGYTVK